MDDLISRQAAIEAVEHITSSMSVCINTDECHGMNRMQRQAVIELANLPSAQPEIVRCRDCKHYVFAENRAFGFPVKRCEVTGFEDVDDYDFCSRAERRTNG